MKTLELLAPARTADIGIAAVDCGADAVYLAGPAFGARSAAGNSIEDIRRLCSYAHRFGVRIFATVNTIIYESELEEARTLVRELADAGVDALIVQDPAVIKLAEGCGLALHASTQCSIRTPEDARFAESLGYGRIVLERQLSLKEVRAIRDAVDTELEFFVHGALCVCYSGQCYLSEYLTGRSANRGECAQACRSVYDLEDGEGNVIVKGRTLLSLKDYNLSRRLEELAQAGISSFKIEGRLKGENYVRNVVKAYSEAIDALVAAHPEEYRRASFGTVRGGNVPDLDRTFNRGYTELFLDGEKGRWAATGGGQYIGTVKALTKDGFILEPSAPDIRLSNGDGFCFTAKDGSTVGFRADVADGFRIRCPRASVPSAGTPLYRNLDAAFDRSIGSAKPVREIAARLDVRIGRMLEAKARTEDGRQASVSMETPSQSANNPARMLSSIKDQLSKRSGSYSFSVETLEYESVPFMGAASLNGIRRALAQKLDQLSVQMLPLARGRADASVKGPERVSYKANAANSISRETYSARGAVSVEEAFELSHRSGAELMRSRYCVRHELGLCPKQKKGIKADPLYLLNGGSRFRLDFCCDSCEMTVSAYSRPV